MGSKHETRVRRDHSKCRSRIKEQIKAARDADNFAEVTRLTRWLEELELRWSMGLNSRSAKVIMRNQPSPYFAR